MGQISDAKLQLVRGLIELAPDDAVRNLLLALSSDKRHDDGLTRVQELVEAEAGDRRARNLAFAPVAPLCAPPGPFSGLNFPTRTLSLMWKALKQVAPDETAVAKAQADAWRRNDDPPEVFDTLCARAADGLRGGDPAFAAAAAAAQAGSGLEALAACLDLAPVTRRALEQMPEWLGRMNSEKTAKLRLAYRDVSAVSDDAGPRFFEMLCAHLTEPWLILRVISGVMDRPNEAYVSASELGGFGERVLVDIARRLAGLITFKATAGRDAARTAAEAVHLAMLEIAEFEQSITLAPDGAWGQRLTRLKQALASTIEAHLKATDEAVAHALPLQTKRIGLRAAKGIPRLTTDPDAAQVEAAASLLTFMSEVRSSAAIGGFASARAKALEILEARLDAYVENLLHEIHAEKGIDVARARTFLAIAADLCGLARDERAAQIVRRRAAAA
jgi:hypothetical protein